MPVMTLQEIDAYDLRQAALHECGHAVMTMHYGMEGSPGVWRNTSADVVAAKRWLGTTHYEPIGMTPLRLRRIAIAGLMAEWIDSAASQEDCDPDDFYSIIAESVGEEHEESDGWSKSDWLFARGWTRRDVDFVFMILKRKWKALLEEAEFLMADAPESGASKITPWMRSLGLSPSLA